MAKAVLVKTVIFDEALYRGHGDIGKWVKLITRHFGEHAVRYAPERSGQLKAGIKWTSRRVGPRQVAGTIESRSPHTMYVLRGTANEGTGLISTSRKRADPGGGTIMVWRDFISKTGVHYSHLVPERVPGYWMPLPAFAGYHKGWADYVSGQVPQNFLLQAWRATARNHRSIRGWVPTFIGRP